jgi:23S rRNA (cytosine1962-C5)-methyltransferase
VSRIRDNAVRNGLTNIEARAMNVFDELRELERIGERFDTIVLDPPAFAKNKASVRKALSGYKEINLRALKLLEPGGFLVTCSCSYNVSEAAFIDVVADAAVDAHAEVTLVEKRTQARDHPILINVPETYYLKCLILRKLA